MQNKEDKLNFKEWDGDLQEMIVRMTVLQEKAKEYGIETIFLCREHDRLSGTTRYRSVNSCDYVVATGLLQIALQDALIDAEDINLGEDIT